jgi:hypothetical protein
MIINKIPNPTKSENLIHNLLNQELGELKWLVLYQTPDNKINVMVSENVTDSCLIAVLQKTLDYLQADPSKN